MVIFPVLNGNKGGGDVSEIQEQVDSNTSEIVGLKADVGQVQTDIADLRQNGGSGGSGDIALTELVKSDVITGDVMIAQIPPVSPIQMKAGLVKAYQFIADGETAVDVVRSYDNTVASVFEQNDMLVFSSSGTHIKVEFEEVSAASETSGEYTLYTFGVDLMAIKELELL
jgi:hypothetical protein